MRSLVRQFIGKARKKFAVVFDLRRRAELLPVFLNGADAMRADRHDFLHLVLGEGFQIRFGELLEEQVIAESANRIAGAFLLAQDSVARARDSSSLVRSRR